MAYLRGWAPRIYGVGHLLGVFSHVLDPNHPFIRPRSMFVELFIFAVWARQHGLAAVFEFVYKVGLFWVRVRQLDPPPCSGSARPSGSAWPSRAFPKSIGGVGEPLRHNQPSGPSEFELGRGLPQELGRASIMEESAPLFYVCPRLRPRRGLHRRFWRR